MLQYFYSFCLLGIAKMEVEQEIKRQIDQNGEEITCIVQEIAQIEAEIKSINGGIARIVEEIAGENDSEVEKLLRDKENKLWDEKKQLRDKEKQLRDKENKLWDEKKQLRDERREALRESGAKRLRIGMSMHVALLR